MASSQKDKQDKVEYERGFERLKRRRSITKINRRLATALLFVFLVIFALVAVVLIFFRVSEIKVTGNDVYNDQDIIDSSGIKYGTNIYLVDSGKVKDTLISQFPFIKTVRMERSVPSTIVLDIESDEAMFYTEISGEYFVISRELRVLGYDSSPEALLKKYPGLKRLVTAGIAEAIVGRSVVFTKSNYFDEMKSLVEIIGSSDVYAGVTTVDISDKYSIKLIYNHIVKASLGGSSDFELKLRFLNEIIKDMGDRGGSVDIENVEMGYLIPSDGETFD